MLLWSGLVVSVHLANDGFRSVDILYGTCLLLSLAGRSMLSKRKILQVIRDSMQRRGYPPSVREIGEAVGLAGTSSVASSSPLWRARGTCAATVFSDAFACSV
jgi:hypothetical protein